MKCPCCDQELPTRPEIKLVPKYNIIMANGSAVVVAPQQFKLIQSLLRINRTRPMLVDALYDDREDGGPEAAYWCVSEILGRTNKRLKDIGYKIMRSREGNSAFIYRLTRVA